MLRKSDPVGDPGTGRDIHGIAVVLGGGANVIMQLSQLPVGRGVKESTVESGNLFKHPIKRTRTTLAFLITALEGTPEDRIGLRREINRAHAAVRSGPSSPVAYNAFDPTLQLWVGSCIYRGYEDTYIALSGPPDAAAREIMYRNGMRFCTTLQVPESMWPADRDAFEQYWNDQLKHIEVDADTYRLLRDIADLKFLPRPFSLLFGRVNRFFTTGFLPAPFRMLLGLSWDEARQRRFDRTLRVIARVSWAMPPVLRRFPMNLILWDTQRRLNSGKPVV